MGKTAFIFPGQGAQYVGMGSDFYEKSEEAREMFDLAARVTGIDIKHLCFEENEEINITEFTQIAMLADEVAILKAAQEAGLKCDVAAGLSLGEYGAIVAAGIISPEDAFKVIRERGIAMQQAYPSGGAMSAVLGMEAEPVEKICAAVAEETGKVVSVANYNCPGQIVITGEADAVAAAGEKLKEAGAKRVLPLKVSGPFHSKLLASAAERLTEVLEDVELTYQDVPYVANLIADYVYSHKDTKALLSAQVCGSVRWQQSVEKMIAEGVDTFVEIGPGKTLSGFMRKINKDVKVVNIDKYEDLAAAVEALNV